MLIQVDVDNTLYDSDGVFQTCAREFGLEWPQVYYKWFGPEFINTDLDTLLAVFKLAHSDQHVPNNEPYPDAVDVLRGIVEDYPGVEIAYVSDRNEQQGEILREWLEAYGFLSNPDQHVVVSKDKRAWMRDRRPEILIDDRVRTMLMARYELGSQVISLEHEYNMNLIGEAEGIYIVPTWKDIDTVLRETVIPYVRADRFVYQPNEKLIKGHV